MESTGSSTRSTAPAADTSLLALAIRDMGKQLALAQQGPSPTLSRPPSSSSRIPEFKCLHCPRTFKTARARGGHLKTHKHRRQLRQNQMEQRRRFALAAPQVRVWSPLLHAPFQRADYFNFHTQLFNSHYFPSSAGRSGAVANLFAGTSTGGGLAPAQPSSAPANGYVGTVYGGQVRNGGHLGILRHVNQGETVHRIHYFPSLPSSAVPVFLSQTGSGPSSLPQPLFAAPAMAAEGNGGNGDGVHLGGQQQDMPQVNQADQENTDGIDLTLRL